MPLTADLSSRLSRVSVVGQFYHFFTACGVGVPHGCRPMCFAATQAIATPTLFFPFSSTNRPTDSTSSCFFRTNIGYQVSARFIDEYLLIDYFRIAIFVVPAVRSFYWFCHILLINFSYPFVLVSRPESNLEFHAWFVHF